MSDETVLQLEAIVRRYGRGETTIEVLNGVELSLRAGESVALIAPSGAGKSTLLHIAGLLERPDAGEVHVGGHATSTMNDESRTALRRSEIGFVYQFHHLLPDVVAAEDPDRPYWPSSASSGIPFSDPNGQQRGDTHYWDVWHGRKPFEWYRTCDHRFNSEFGFQSFCFDPFGFQPFGRTGFLPAHGREQVFQAP